MTSTSNEQCDRRYEKRHSPDADDPFPSHQSLEDAVRTQKSAPFETPLRLVQYECKQPFTARKDPDAAAAQMPKRGRFPPRRNPVRMPVRPRMRNLIASAVDFKHLSLESS
jgi:hypothetical protein